MKKQFYSRVIVVGLMLFFCACSVVQSETGPEQITIVSWNVQNLFDGTDNGSEYNEFKNSGGWNNEKYQARLQSIAAALKGENSVKADILALIEIENEAVVRDLAESSLLDYGWYFFAGSAAGAMQALEQQGEDSAADSPVGIGVLSALPLTETKVHSIHSPDGSIPRPIAEVWADTGTGPLVLLVCHWKSKLGGEKKTESLRRASAALIVRRLAEIEAENPGTPVIILGDLNENYDEFYRIDSAYPCALLPDTEEAAALTGKNHQGVRLGFQDFLILSGEKPPRTDFFAGSAGIVYSPWFELNRESNFGSDFEMGIESKADKPVFHGSYYYKETWETIDHFLLNEALFSGSGWNYGSFLVLARPPFTNEAGQPRPYNPRTGNGFSDHLPIVLCLKKL
jgi:endonuclease/exonuclease/phosphatase family metal-dependent hydrolase